MRPARATLPHHLAPGRREGIKVPWCWEPSRQPPCCNPLPYARMHLPYLTYLGDRAMSMIAGAAGCWRPGSGSAPTRQAKWHHRDS